jgi:V8-like Glu-specific endopeptidase
MTRWLYAACAALLLSLCQTVHADEGMWTFHGFPFAKANAALKTNIDQAWLDRVRSATVRITGCTGSFVSPEGLILTNHHCVEACLAEMSSKEKSFVEDGYLAKTRDDEKKCQTQIADVLTDMQDITTKVKAATAGKPEAAANDARKAKLTELEQECENSTKLKCQSVTFYEGGQYWMYKYKRYTDLRLVFAPEAGIASFGGDPDNFQFPRFDLDMGIMRAYENGAPVKPANYLHINFAGPAAGEAVFVSGHPGSTNRQLTVAELKMQRDMEFMQWLLRYSEIRGRLIQFAESSAENGRITADLLNSIENSIKVRRKMMDALHDDAMLKRKVAEQEALQKGVAKDAKLKVSVGDPWKDIETAMATERKLFEEYIYLEAGGGFQGRMMSFARAIVRGTTEKEKPNATRYREYTDASLPRIEQQLGAKLPVYPELEILRLGNGLERMREWLGPDHPVVRKLLATESPAELAKRVITTSKLADPAVRMELWKGGSAAVNASTDPMIQLWRDVDPAARTVRKAYEDSVEAPVQHATERIAQARFATLGTSVYPDATFTLRLNWGTVQGWDENGTPVVPFTKLGRAFERATGADPFRIPDSWTKVKDKLDLNTPFNLSSNNDIVGGNSGSPLINAKGELVGLMFDGNIHSISGNYWFDTSKNRAIAVDTTIIKEALTKVYAADALLSELSR